MKLNASNKSSTTQRGSIFSKARNSIFRSKGERGADVKTLRGLTGADFEGEVRVTRGRTNLFSCICGGKELVNKKRYIMIKGPNLFVFADMDAPSPKYAIELAHKKIERCTNQQIVYLDDGLGTVQYEFKFNLHSDPGIAEEFVVALRKQIAAGNVYEVKEGLGHHPESGRSKSVTFATTIAEKKVKEQPVSVSVAEVLIESTGTMRGRLLKIMST
mmetsp:Transcript_5309/g.7935  ORF Transcript_5309/g.7935 Transcript_5309/m.7935 type:complete len:216 (+) Transcript_5309:49-696(+)|eukprot:CAMPEP_0197245154 /NCGR_PEP_ID=MMETSP1429-20130617/10029_1 /TAXON_ID=49237 /ORGANISM="Chaetoceros  sp., Strain UNC1202" /LENGTH=215 /DNA_ID=CAMNT_0042705599 /DNA_START=56 /DNA_END=703 /DNA_ORIENTATION=+